MAQLKLGDLAPDFATVDEQGQPVRLHDLRGKRVVLYFYPEDSTPGCTTQACSSRDHYGDLGQRNAIVLGVSPDSAKSHQNFKIKFELPFPLLLDPERKIAGAYDVWREKQQYGRKYMGISRSHFVIDEQGRIADAQYNVKAAQSAEKALGALDQSG